MKIVVDYDLPGAPAKVWRALTDPKLLATWLMENDINAEVGHHFMFKSRPMGDWDGTVRCEVLAVEPNARLQYSWRGGNLDTIVTWTLTPNGSGTRLHLEHDGFTDENSFAFEAMGKGWRGKQAELAQLSGA